MAENISTEYRDKLLEKIDRLEAKISKTNNEAQMDIVRNIRHSIENNLLMAELANSDGLKILIEYIRLERQMALRQILNKQSFFDNKEKYQEEAERAWNKIDQIEWFLDLLVGRDQQLHSLEETIDEEIGEGNQDA